MPEAVIERDLNYNINTMLKQAGGATADASGKFTVKGVPIETAVPALLQQAGVPPQTLSQRYASKPLLVAGAFAALVAGVAFLM